VKPAKIPYSYHAIMERHKRKHASIQFRNDLLKAQTRANYHNEYDRLTGILNNTVLRHGDKERLMNRKDELRKLAQDSFHPPHHEIYNKK
jgi:hypothetical protein